jgi:lipopolysaccharide assembly protein A
MFYLILAFAFSLVVAIFAVQNSLPVTIAFLSWSFQTSLVIVILGAATFGALSTLSLAMLMQIKARWALKKVKQHQGELEAEINTLKARIAQEPTRETIKEGP